jgi:hypothetical protein
MRPNLHVKKFVSQMLNGIFIIIKKYILWSTDISVLIAAMFYLQKNYYVCNELNNYKIDFK